MTQVAPKPPSIASAAPVTKLASEESSLATNAAISSGSATRADGFGASRESRGASAPTPSRLR